MSGRNWLYTGCPTAISSTNTQMVDPFVGMTAGCGVSAHPNTVTVPDTSWPLPGVSRVPKGFVDAALFTEIEGEPRSFVLPSRSCAYAYSVYVPLPVPG